MTKKARGKSAFSFAECPGGHGDRIYAPTCYSSQIFPALCRGESLEAVSKP